MLRLWQFNVLLLIGAVALALAAVNGALLMHNRSVQTDINLRQQYLQQTVGLDGLYRDVVRALAELAVKNNDAQLLQMLAAQGINVSVTPAAVPPAAAAAPPPAPAKR